MINFNDSYIAYQKHKKHAYMCFMLLQKAPKKRALERASLNEFHFRQPKCLDYRASSFEL